MTTTSTNVKLTTLALLGVALLTGCAKDGAKKHVNNGEDFPAAGQPRSIDRIANAQIAAGARADATLYGHHFDQGELNSLGKQKLRNLLRDDDACEPLVLYFDTPGVKADDDLGKSRRETVKAFLVDEGLLESQVQFKQGHNPATGGPASAGLEALSGNGGAGAAPASPVTIIGAK